jgi:hypothetical protein
MVQSRQVALVPVTEERGGPPWADAPEVPAPGAQVPVPDRAAASGARGGRHRRPRRAAAPAGGSGGSGGSGGRHNAR